MCGGLAASGGAENLFEALLGEPHGRLPSARRYAHRKEVEAGKLIQVPIKTLARCTKLALGEGEDSHLSKL